MGKGRVRSDVFNGEDKEFGGDMPKRFLRIMRAASNPSRASTEDKPSKPSFERVQPGESFAEYNSRLSKGSKIGVEKKESTPELYLKPSLAAALGDAGKSKGKPIRPKRKEFLQKRKEKKLLQKKLKRQQDDPIIHQSSIPKPLRDIVQEPPKLKPNK
jgi:hypothetical protein